MRWITLMSEMKNLNKQLWVGVFSLVGVFVGVGGCGEPVRYAYDGRRDQPMVGGGVKATGYLTGRTEWLQPRAWLEWADAGGRGIERADGAVLRSQRFLDGVGRMDLADEGAAEGVAKVIVNLEPLVVLVGPGPVVYRKEFQVEPIPDGAGFEVAAGKEVSGSGEARLPWGYFYGTAVGYTGECVWFSPDLGVGPVAAEVVVGGDGVEMREIRVGEVVLRLRHVGDFWRVEGAQGAATRP